MHAMLKTWTPDDVQKADDKVKAYCNYVQQIIGVPYPTGKDIAIVRRKAKDFFKLYPQADWYTLCRVAHWCKARKRRPAYIHNVIDSYRFAWSAGYIPELSSADRKDENVEQQIALALQVERRDGWRRRLILSSGPEQRKKVLDEWRQDTQMSSSSH